jgi:hypothetical protein
MTVELKYFCGFGKTHDVGVVRVRVEVLNQVEKASLMIDKQKDGIFQVETVVNISGYIRSQGSNTEDNGSQRETHFVVEETLSRRRMKSELLW